ncbi:MAG: MFS transporter [Alphaproteobacteria bacterium]|jgi:MFS family permease|nr:MFS transporter [Alphaproteobacteria bacterium]
MSSSRLTIVFAAAGHAVMHILTGLFLVIVLTLESVWAASYDTLIQLWTLGAFLVGAGAPLAGWLSDRFGETRVMIVFFLGSGLSTVYAGLVDDTPSLFWALGFLGLFAAIYHPVGTAWIVKNAIGRGRVMGIVGLSGSIGFAAAAVIAGGLVALSGWRSAFLIPGLVSVAIGLVLAWLYASGRIVDREHDLAPAPEDDRSDIVRAFVILTIALLLGSLYYAAFITVLPKWLSDGFEGVIDGGVATIGGLVTVIYLVGATAQIGGGWLADRYSPKWIYVAAFAIKLPVTLLAVAVGGWAMLPVAMAMAFTMDLAAPAENVLLARYSPSRRRGLVYGLKYVASFAAFPLGIEMVALSYRWSGAWDALYLALAALALAMLLAALFLPAERPRPLAATAPAGS